MKVAEIPAPCILPDESLGVRRHHSDDRVTIFHGSTDPIVACGFHATYYLEECYRASREIKTHV
jgi:hypothetical protein